MCLYIKTAKLQLPCFNVYRSKMFFLGGGKEGARTARKLYTATEYSSILGGRRSGRKPIVHKVCLK